MSDVAGIGMVQIGGAIATDLSDRVISLFDSGKLSAARVLENARQSTGAPAI